ncbi:recombinase family protein [Streptomyces sp. NPDC019443]|uniref:recombinase family protein n=1 Tax=Streptomyces sp. NPDC019443 TaxID=3365061 RepID=UPI00379A469A
MSTRAASRSSSRPRAAYTDTASAYAAPSAFTAIRRARSADIAGRTSRSTPSRATDASNRTVQGHRRQDPPRRARAGRRPHLIGYARGSTAGQNPDHHIDALLRSGVDRDNIHVDTASGAKASRPKLDLVMQLLREGDALKVTRLDRLSRSVLHLVTLGARERGIGLHAIEQGIDTSTMEGRAMFGMLSVLAELQRELIVADTNDGLASARARGRVGGRRPKVTPDQAELAQRPYDAREKTVQQIADIFNVPRSTVYGHLDREKTVPRQPKETPRKAMEATGWLLVPWCPS